MRPAPRFNEPSGIETALEPDGASVCVSAGATTEPNLAARRLAMQNSAGHVMPPETISKKPLPV